RCGARWRSGLFWRARSRSPRWLRAPASPIPPPSGRRSGAGSARARRRSGCGGRRPPTHVAEPERAAPCTARAGHGMRSPMPATRFCESALEAVADVGDGATLLVHSFGPPQAWPPDCLLALARRGVRDLTVICNTPAGGPTSLNILAEKKQLRKLVCSYVTNPSFQTPIGEQVRAGEIALEMVPQGTLIERVRAGGAGLAGFYTPTGAGTLAAKDKEVREFDGRPYVFERAIRADFALLQAHRADGFGNLTYRRGMRNFGPAFAMGARTTIAEVKETVPVGTIDPEEVVTPGIFIDRVVRTTTQFDPAVLRQILMAVGRTTEQSGRCIREGGPVGLPPDLMGMKAAALLRDGEYVNLG